MTVIVTASLGLVILLSFCICAVVKRRQIIKHREEGSIYFQLIDNPEYVKAFENALSGQQ